MRYVLLLLFLLLVVLIFLFSDFFLVRQVRGAITGINSRAQSAHRFKPISIPNCLILSALFWVPPFLLLGERHLLETKIFITLLFWTLLSAGLHLYIRARSSRKSAGEALPFLICFAVAGGLVLGPVLSALLPLLR